MPESTSELTKRSMKIEEGTSPEYIATLNFFKVGYTV